MSDTVRLRVNGREVAVERGTIVAAAVTGAFRRSVSGEGRGPLCGMGICMECRVTIDGRAHARSCQVLVAEGMEVETDEV